MADKRHSSAHRGAPSPSFIDVIRNKHNSLSTLSTVKIGKGRPANYSKRLPRASRYRFNLNRRPRFRAVVSSNPLPCLPRDCLIRGITFFSRHDRRGLINKNVDGHNEGRHDYKGEANVRPWPVSSFCILFRGRILSS